MKETTKILGQFTGVRHHLITIGLMLQFSTNLQAGPDPQQFQNPPESARPRTWMHALIILRREVGMSHPLQSALTGQTRTQKT